MEKHWKFLSVHWIYGYDCFSCFPDVTKPLLGLLVGIRGVTAGWVHLSLDTIFLEESMRLAKALTFSFIWVIWDCIVSNSLTSGGTAADCMCWYCGIYAPCIAVLAAMNCRKRETDRTEYIHVLSTGTTSQYKTSRFLDLYEFWDLENVARFMELDISVQSNLM